MIPSKRVAVVFDFDGVLSDSIHDSFLTALNAYVAMEGGKALTLDGPIDPPERIFTFESQWPDFFGRFRSLLPMGHRAEDYYVILTAMAHGQDGRLADQGDFNAYKATFDPSRLAAYETLFYHIRAERQSVDPAGWARLLPPFPGIPETVRRLHTRCLLAIATAKDRPSVLLLLDRYGLLSFFHPDAILDKDQAEDKRVLLRSYAERHHLSYGDLHFIDDKVRHLVDVATLGVRCYLALWGYNTPREHALAKAHGFDLLSLADMRSFDRRLGIRSHSGEEVQAP